MKQDRMAAAREINGRTSPPILVVCLGNPILGDDGVGWRVGEEVLARLQSMNSKPDNLKVIVERLSVGGLGLMERMIGYRKTIIVDAISTGEGIEGSLLCLPLSALPDHSSGHTTSAHDTSLQNALNMGHEMGLDVPSEIWVVGIEARKIDEFSEQLSPAVEAAIPGAASSVLRLLLDGPGEVEDHDLT